MSERTEADIEIPRAAAGPRNDSPAGAPFDVIHVHWPMPQGLLLPRRLPAGARVVTTFYGADVALARKIPALRGPLRAVVERSDAVAAISRHTAAAVAELTGVEPAVIPYGVDMAPRGDPADARQGERAGVEVLTVGRLIERKGHLVLLEAMARLRERRRDVALTIVGEGHERPRIEARVRELGLSDCVRLAGRVSDAELRAAYAGCDMFVLPAIVDSAGDTEGLGMVLLEAMRYQRPCIASRLGGITDIVADGETGLLVPPADPPALAAAIERLADDAALARTLGEAGRRINAARFAWDGVVEAYQRLYRGEAADGAL